MKKIGLLIVGVLLGLALGVFLEHRLENIKLPELPRLGSVDRSNDYHATTTYNSLPTKELYPTTSTVGLFADKVSGSLGTVIITGTTLTGQVDIYDATTTNVNLRAASMTTNTIILASFPAGMTTGTYVFDEVYYNGLTIVTRGTVPTTTITYR